VDYLVDTNVLLRALANPNAHKLAARNAIETLLQRNADLCVTPQNLIEFWGVCTRPAKQNGLGKSIAITDRYCRFAESFLTVLPEGPGIFSTWRSLVVHYGISGKQVHDARIVAAMITNGVPRLLTFDTGDFSRYTEI
jgi:predicted nucleic acid-binding protein